MPNKHLLIIDPAIILAGQPVDVKLVVPYKDKGDLKEADVEPGIIEWKLHPREKNENIVRSETSPECTLENLREGSYKISCTIDNKVTVSKTINVMRPERPLTKQGIEDIIDNKPIRVALEARKVKYDGFVQAILCHSDAISFQKYEDYIEKIFCTKDDFEDHKPAVKQIRTKDNGSELFHGVHAYDLLKEATELFLLLNCGVKADRNTCDRTMRNRWKGDIDWNQIEDSLNRYFVRTNSVNIIPYLDRIVRYYKMTLPEQMTSAFCDNVELLEDRVSCPVMIELIWNYYMEEGMLVQAMNAISMRFQNKKISDGKDFLTGLTLSPLRPLSNLLWGYIQDEIHRLTIQRRAYEYDNSYGLTLLGRAVPKLRSVESRSNFLEAFNSLMLRCAVFFQEESDNTVTPDTFPLLNALKEVHILLGEGDYNQFGDLTWTSRVEMLTQQWLLARPEMREFLHGKPMVSFPEGWMPHVETLKGMLGWVNVSVRHFRDLAVHGERILLSIRYGDWDGDADDEDARAWAVFFKQDIQQYVHSYRAVTSVDLTNPETMDFTMPAVHIQNRLMAQSRS